MSAPTNQFTAVAATAPQKKKSRRTLIIVLVLVAVVIGVLVAVAASKRKEPGIQVSIEKAVVKTITHLVTATGKVQPELEVKISPEVSGELIALPFKEGQAVKKGDVIVRVKPDLYQAQVEQQEASLASAKASADLAH